MGSGPQIHDGRVTFFHPNGGSVENTNHIDWHNKRVLVTGADGFIGSHLTEALATAGARVTALCLYNSFDSRGWLDDLNDELRGEVTIVQGDIRDSHQMVTLCKNQDTVFHLAALMAIPYSYDAPSSYAQTNIQGTINLLMGARAADVQQFIHTSTSEVYGTAQICPIPESHPLQGQSPYAASKIGADAMVEAFSRSFDLPAVTLRPFNTYGPRQSQRAVISTVIRQALDPNLSEIRVGSLTPTRDFNFVADTVSAFFAIAGLAGNGFGKVFNAGSGRMVSIGETVEQIRTSVGTNKPIVQDELRLRPNASEVMTLMADARALTAKTGWQPSTSLEDGIEKTVLWWRSHLAKTRSDGSVNIT